jgi:hypothetical protein
MTFLPAGLFLGLVLLPGAAGAQGDGLVPLGGLRVPPCPSDADPEYGLVKEKAIAIGGGPVFMAARQRRFIEALRGPGGEPVRIEGGVGSGPLDPAVPGGPIIDRYTVVYDGPDGLVTTSLFFDAYHFTAPKAPAGFTCRAPLATAVGVPPADPFRAGVQVAALAIELGPTLDVSPIPLVSGDRSSGALYDRFATIALQARAAAEAGTPLDPAALPRDPAPAAMTLLAYPAACGDRPVVPTTMELLGPRGPVAGQGEPARGDVLAAVLPGVTAPEGSVALGFPLAQPAAVRLTYDGECVGESRVTLLVTPEPPRLEESPPPALPPGVDEAEPTIYLQAIIGPDGRFGQALHLGGPPSLWQPALDAIATWRARPLRVNGAPVVSPVVLQVTFR